MKMYHMWSHHDLHQILANSHSYDKVKVFAAEEFAFCADVQFNPTIEIEWMFGGADPNYYKGYPGNVVLWDTFFLYWSFVSFDDKLLIRDTKIEKIFVSLNHRAHSHRCLMMDMLAKHKMLKLGNVSWRNIDKDPYKFQYWNPKIIKFNDGFLKKITQHTPPTEFNNALINLISESTTETIFVTEKTYNAIYAEKPFLIQGAPGIHRYLQSLGFQLYDEIFDYTFDDIKDTTKRTEQIILNLKKLKNKDLNKINEILKDKAKYNRKHAIDIIKNQEYVPDAIQEFKYYRELTKEAKCKLDLLD